MMSGEGSAELPASLGSLNPRWRITPVVVPILAAGTIPVLGTDSERWCLVAVADITGAFLCSENPDPLALANGLPIPVAWPLLQLDYRTHGAWVQGAWQIFSAMPGINVRLWAISWRS